MKHAVYEHHLAGGASGLLIDVPGSEVVNLTVRFNSGYQFAAHDKYEVPHVMEHLLATVTKDHPGSNEFIIDAQKNGAYVNASTSVDSNAYMYEFADFETDRILDLVQEQLMAPLFEKKSLQAELGNVREELSRNTTQHAAVCSIQLAEAAFPKLWLGFPARIAQLEGIDLENVREHYEATHTSENARFFVSGSLGGRGDAVAARLDKIFAQMPRGNRLQRSRKIGLGLSKPVVAHRDIAQVYYRSMMYFVELSEAERRALTLLRLVLVGGMGSRIYGEARRRGLAYSIGAAGHAQSGNSSFGFAGFVTPGNAADLFELIARGYREVAEGKLTEAELTLAKNLGIGSLKRSTQTAGDVVGWYIEAYDESGEIRDFYKSIELLQGVSVSEVVAVAKKAAAYGRRGMSFLGDIDDARAADYSQILS